MGSRGARNGRPGGQGKDGWGKGGELFPEQLCEQVEEVLVSRRPDRTKGDS